MNGDKQNECQKLNKRYKGIVVTNIDPKNQGRLLVKVPDILSIEPCIWAESASPLAGPQMGMYFVPPTNAGVWVEFQNGDPNFPIWTGCWRGSELDIPQAVLDAPPGVPPIVTQSLTQNKIIISSVPGKGIILETALGELGPRIELDATGITISAGQGMITIKGSLVNINDGALTIMGA